MAGCSVKDDRLFQTIDGSERNVSIVSNEQYEEEVRYEYKIAPNDRLSITVYVQSANGSQQMSSILASSDSTRQGLTNIDAAAGLLVTQDGTVRLPLIGAIKVTGLTEDEASHVLISEYKKFIRNPYVTVEITNQRIIVIGEVQQPGIVPVVNGTMNLIEVISRSGYLTEKASTSNITIVRGDLRNPEIRNVDLTDSKSLIASSLLLKPNDIVYVQARKMNGFNKAFEETMPFFVAVSTILNPFVQRSVIRLNENSLK
jgi:polysaccharide export outer membrane protein